FFFFFQAEDGIRDLIVTGVQTCALPISNYFFHGKFWPSPAPSTARTCRGRSSSRRPAPCCPTRAWAPARRSRDSSGSSRRGAPRSEERRVGKEWRAWWVAEA